jgi:uncharacterized membrane protein YfcA
VVGDFSQWLMAFAVFAGAVVSGFTGFAFSAVAGAILLHVAPPGEAVPLMMICSVIVQSINLVSLRRHIDWRGSAMLIIGGLFGLPPALYLLLHADAGVFRICFGIFLATYAGYMLFRPAARRWKHAVGLRYEGAIGFAGGLVGGLTAMPGVAPTIWCDLRGIPKDRQRGLVQPYITAMQIAALGLLAARHGLSRVMLGHILLSLPVLAAGAFVGLMLFGRVNDGLFRRVLLGVLLLSGLTYFV